MTNAEEVESDSALDSEDAGSVSGLNEGVLLEAWAQLAVYDQTASDLKRQFVQRRQLVIVLTLIATIASVVVGIIGGSPVTTVLFIIAFVLPLVGGAIMTDVKQFVGTTDWIKYRYTAEMMRMHIYLYRMQAGVYAEGPLEAMDDLLVTKLRTIKEKVRPDQGVPPTRSEPKDRPGIQQAIRVANSSAPQDNGLGPIAAEKYVEWRIEQQRIWYDNRLKKDFLRSRRYIRAAQIFLLIGSIISALVGFVEIQLVALVAITNSISGALTLWADVALIGKTHSLYRIAKQKLDNLKLEWLGLQNNPEMQDPAKRAEIVANLAQQTESTLLWEREEWFELALQAQVQSDAKILDDLTRLRDRADDAQDQDPGESEG